MSNSDSLCGGNCLRGSLANERNFAPCISGSHSNPELRRQNRFAVRFPKLLQIMLALLHDKNEFVVAARNQFARRYYFLQCQGEERRVVHDPCAQAA